MDLYDKVKDRDGETTVFIRCRNPTESGIVGKVLCTKMLARPYGLLFIT